MSEANPDRSTAASATPVGVLRVVLVYAVFGALWILLSDSALEWLLRDSRQLVWASLLKGWLFIAVTSLLLLVLMRRLVGQIVDAAARARDIQAQKLQALQLLNAISESSTDVIYAKDRDSRYLLCNRAAARLIGRPAEQVLGHIDSDWFPPPQASAAIANDQQVMQGREVASFRETYDTVEGKRSFLSTKGPLLGEAGEVIGLFGISRDITEQQHAEELLHESERSYRLLTEQVPVIIYRASVDKYSKTIYISPRVAKLGYTMEEWMGNPEMWERLLHPEDRPEVLRKLAESHAHAVPLSAEYRLRTKDGEWRYISDEAQVICDDHGRPLYLQGVMLDITERKQSEANVHRLAYYDLMTGLPNRSLLMDRLGQILTMSRREKRVCALILFNVDRLKTLNDALGHGAGDRLLTALAERLASILREDDTLARMTGDEFAILVQGLDDDVQVASRHAHLVADKIHNSLKQPFVSGMDEVTITASLGVTLFPELERDAADDILRRADTALHRAKKAGGNQTAFFETDMEELASQRFQIERELRQALRGDELRLYLQTQVDANGNEVGAEALVRWQHPQRGLVLPGAFVPVAEESDLIIELDLWMLRAVCQLLTRPGLVDTAQRISVNISPRHFRQPSFVESLRNMLLLTGADPSRLTLEVTEGLMIENMGDVVAKMTELAAIGIHFSVDDFGTGYSSLAYLKRLPIHELKIDKTFVQDAPDDPDDAALVEVILAIASHLRLKIVAEGVETREQAEFLNARARVVHQGYLFFRPEPVEDWVRRRQNGVA